MKIVRRKLADGVKQMYEVKIGKKIKIVNTNHTRKNPKTRIKSK